MLFQRRGEILRFPGNGSADGASRTVRLGAARGDALDRSPLPRRPSSARPARLGCAPRIRSRAALAARKVPYSITNPLALEWTSVAPILLPAGCCLSIRTPPASMDGPALELIQHAAKSAKSTTVRSSSGESRGNVVATELEERQVPLQKSEQTTS